MNNQLDLFDECSVYALKQQSSFFNTTNERGQDLSKNVLKAQAQDEKILSYFRRKKTFLISPTQVWEAIFTASTPLTSVRRSINTLTKKGFLIKTNIKRAGNFGRKEFCWKLLIK
jgi:Fe2+ or Zn2+ uptake regulation protein